jgi:hypothetical protein
VKQFQQTESNHPDANQIDRDHQVQQPRHYQNKNASDQRKDSWNMNGRDVHAFLQMRLSPYRIRTTSFYRMQQETFSNCDAYQRELSG